MAKAYLTLQSGIFIVSDFGTVLLCIVKRFDQGSELSLDGVFDHEVYGVEELEQLGDLSFHLDDNCHAFAQDGLGGLLIMMWIVSMNVYWKASRKDGTYADEKETDQTGVFNVQFGNLPLDLAELSLDLDEPVGRDLIVLVGSIVSCLGDLQSVTRLLKHTIAMGALWLGWKRRVVVLDPRLGIRLI